MTPLGWLALAAACVLVAARPGIAPRTDRLGRAGRLVASPGTGGARSRLATLPWTRFAVPASAAVLAAGWIGLGPVLALTLAAVCAVALAVGRDSLRRRAAVADQRAVLAAVRVLVAELEAGSLPAPALLAAAEVGGRSAPDLERAAAAQESGAAAGDLLVGSGDPALRAIGVAWRLGESTGAALAGVLSRVGADLSAVAEQRRAVAVVLAGPRSSAVLLAGLPVLGLALGAGMGARPIALLTGGPGGQLLCAAGVALDLAGVLWMRRILRAAEAGVAPAGAR